MELKKNPKYDLIAKIPMLRMLGLTVSLCVVIVAFEIPGKGEEVIIDLGNVRGEFEEIMDLPITEHLPPPPPQIQVAQIKEVPDETIIEEEIEIELDVEVTEFTSIDEIEFVESDMEEEPVEEVFTVVEVNPEYPGGIAAFYQFIGERIKYPNSAARLGVEGRVYVEFIVGKDGALRDIRVVKGIGAGCDEEAERVMKMVPKFNPGKQRGRPVHVKMVLPIYFKLME